MRTRRSIVVLAVWIAVVVDHASRAWASDALHGSEREARREHVALPRWYKMQDEMAAFAQSVVADGPRWLDPAQWPDVWVDFWVHLFEMPYLLGHLVGVGLPIWGAYASIRRFFRNRAG